ncbi:MAG: V4R domain-containing protein [Candidatus Hodarchaeota archaeon]
MTGSKNENDVRKEDVKIGFYLPPRKRENEVRTASVPPEMEPLFSNAEDQVLKFFTNVQWDPTKGTINISGNRYFLLSCESFRDLTRSLSEELQIPEEKANNLYYRLAKIIGQSDARRFHYAMNVQDPIAKLSAGPVHFAFTGNAFVSILPSNPTTDEDYVLVYDHPQSFEADIWIRKYGTNSKLPVCYWNSGYSAGWCSESFGLILDAQEIHCRARGEKQCRFVMAPRNKLDERVKEAEKKGM